MPTNSRAVTTTRRGDVWLTELSRPYTLASPFAGDDFVLMLLVQDASISPAEQEALSEALVAQGCRYAVCAGHNCSSWDDSIDQAFLQTDPNFDPPDARFVMTTWHDDEPLDEVTWFFLWNTEYDSHVPRRFLAAVLGGDDRFTQQVIDALVRNAARSDGA